MVARWRSKPIGMTPQEHQPIKGWARGINLKTHLRKGYPTMSTSIGLSKNLQFFTISFEPTGPKIFVSLDEGPNSHRDGVHGALISRPLSTFNASMSIFFDRNLKEWF